MKQINYLLGLVAMVVMMTMTACKGDVNSDVQKVCDILDETAAEMEETTTPQELFNALYAIQNIEEDIDTNVKLNEEDKAALKESFMNICTVMVDKIADFNPGAASRDEIDESMKQLEQKVDEIVSESNTLGDFAENISKIN